MKKSAIFLITCGALLLFACGDDSSTNQDRTVMMPLKVGNEWTGTLTTVDPGGEHSGSMTIRVQDRIIVNNEKWYIMQHIIDGEIIYPDQMHTNRYDGVWVWYTCRDSIAGEPLMWAKYPAEVGDTFTTGHLGLVTATLVSKDTSVSVPLGDFDCYCYFWLPNILWPPVHYYYVVPQLGIVKWEMYCPGPDDAPYLCEKWELEGISSD